MLTFSSLKFLNTKPHSILCTTSHMLLYFAQSILTNSRIRGVLGCAKLLVSCLPVGSNMLGIKEILLLFLRLSWSWCGGRLLPFYLATRYSLSVIPLFRWWCWSGGLSLRQSFGLIQILSLSCTGFWRTIFQSTWISLAIQEREHKRVRMAPHFKEHMLTR